MSALKSVSILAVVLIPFSVQAQELISEPNLLQLPSSSDETTWIESLVNAPESNFEDIFQYFRLANTALKQRRYDLLEKLAQKIFWIAQFHRRFNDVVPLIEQLGNDLEAQSPDKKHIGKIQLILGDAYVQTQRVQRAIEAYQKSKMKLLASGDTANLHLPTTKLAKIFEEQGEIDLAISQMLSVFEFQEEISRYKQIVHVVKDRVYLGRLFAKENRLDDAQEQMDIAIEIATKSGHAIRLHAYSCLIRLLVRHNKLDEARKVIEEVGTWVGQIDHVLALEEFKIERIRFLMASGQENSALGLLDEVSFISDNCHGAADFYELANEVFLANKDYVRAHSAQERLLELSKTQLKNADLRQRQDADAMFRIEMQRKADQERAENSAKIASSARTIRNLIIALAALICSSSFFLYRNHANRKIEMLTLKKQQAINEDLSRIVDEKTAALFSEAEERIDLQNQLEKKRRNEAIGQLTGGVAHDFNNLLQVITTVNELLKTSLDNRLSEHDEKLLESSSNSAEVGAQIIQQLLAFARKQVLQPTALNVTDFIRSQMPLLKTAAGEHIELKLAIHHPNAVIKVDSAQLTTALINLISNAVDAFDDQNQTITITVRTSDECDLARLTEIKSDEYVMIEVEDDGVGMDPTELERACDPFFTTKEHSTGTGLGLSSVQGFVKQSSGDLFIESQPGRGTTVALAFPTIDSHSFADQSDLHDRSDFSSKRLLLVEDHPQVRIAIRLKLENLNIDVDECDNADKAVRILQSQRYDCVLSDIRMPGKIDGVGLHEWLSKNQPETTILLMTGFDHPGKLPNNVAVLPKPFTEQQLMQKLRLATSRTSVRC